MLFQRFLRDRRGGVAPIFALAIIPVIGLVGVAIDYSRAASARTAMQGALDATALYLSKEAATSNPEQIKQKAQAYFNAIYNHAEAKNVTVDAVYTSTSAGNSVRVSATAAVDTSISRVIGHNTIDIGSSSEAVWGIKKLELALALDNTGSMDEDNKMTELKKAAKSLLNTLYKAAKKADDVKVAIIPFATDVNVGKSNKDATWLDWGSWDAENQECKKRDRDNRCIERGAKDHSQWNGCVWDRTKSYDADDSAPTSAATRFQPHQADNCPVEMIGLTDIYLNNAWVESDLTASSPTSVLGKKINDMTPIGATNVTIGVVWGWHALTKSEPLTGASDPKDDLDKVIILLTDGLNTKNRWNGNGRDPCGETCDSRTRLACTNAKAAGIKIYTIRVIEGSADLLRGCATSPNMYYDVQNASQLNAVFSNIAQNLANLRIAK